MKHKFLLLVAMLTAATSMFAQSADNEDEVIKIDKWNQNAYREGEILVKFKADGAVQMRAPRKAKFQTSQVNAVDVLFEELGVDSVEQLMPMTGHKDVGRVRRAYNGKEVKVQDLSKLYRLTLKAEKAQTMFDAIDKLKAQEEVEFAEPNYIVYTMALPYDDSIPTADQQTYTSEPLYSQQWGLQAINLPALWDKPKRSSKRPVIAILDTGVDIEHPDLAANIWTNTSEANGISGQDDDANGFKDDIHGWDFINNHSVTNDFNGHGTHCAGIAAAVGNNGIGITGANPDALIMPVTVMQSNGSGDVATIIKGIDYAAANNADVISMSIGSYMYSIAEEQALGRAYANAVLVAAAGNSHMSISDRRPCPEHKSARSYPGAFSFVLGVEASQDTWGNLAGFSNYDPDGPIFSEFSEDQQYNYELRAPGVQILSTFPGGRYKNLNGTSMACPLVAGAISRLIQCKEFLSNELLFGDLINTRMNDGDGNVNILDAYAIANEDRRPKIWVISINVSDSVHGDNDGNFDAGETVELYPVFKNVWGNAENIHYWIKTGFYFDEEMVWVWDDTTLIHHLQDTVAFGKVISSYSHAKAQNPWRLQVSPDCADGREINLSLFATCDGMNDTVCQHLIVTIENGVEIGGMITEDMTLYPNVHYIVTRPLAVPAGVTLTIKPGTIIKFKDGTGISASTKMNSTTMIIDGVTRTVRYPDPTINGGVIARGTPDSMIVFTKAEGEIGNYSLGFGMSIPELASTGGYNNSYVYLHPQCDSIIALISDYPLEYIKIQEMNTSKTAIASAYLKNCIIENCAGSNSSFLYNSTVVHCGVYNSMSTFNLLNYDNNSCYSNTIFANNVCNFDYTSTWETDNYNYQKCNIFVTNRNIAPYLLHSAKGGPTIINLYPNYFGSSREDIVRNYIWDIERGHSFGYFDLSNMLTRPSSEAHGIVWKILVDGVDAQDEFEQLPPIGVGTHRCDVYFNRPMDVSVAPTISFGVRQPYTQHQVAENGSWSADSTIYTAYFTIDGKSVTDGLNTFKVSGAEDNEHFEIPEENYRFHMEVAAAGSMSTGLMAEAGLGKVTLTWETDEEDFADLLGYNIYRWTHDTIKWDLHYDNEKGQWIDAGWRIDTICVNTSLLDAADTAFVDYNVVPGKDYYYVIRQVTTSLNSYDLSNAVVARPLTAIKGDANGSMAVDVADVITEVNYITRQNPQPFIFEAADVNSDDQVNIIDVVATVDLILHPQSQTNAINDATAFYYIENGILYVESDAVLGGVQCTFEAEQGHTFTALSALNEFEKVGTWQSEEQYMFMAYSMSGKTLSVGKTALLQIGEAELTNIILSDAQGHNVAAAPRISQALDGTTFVPAASKYLQEGALYIKHGKHIYNVMGTLIK